MPGINLMMNLIEQLKEHEGFRANYYLCSSNKKTIGYGRNLDNNPFSNKELAILGRSEFDAQPITTEMKHGLDSHETWTVTWKTWTGQHATWT